MNRHLLKACTLGIAMALCLGNFATTANAQAMNFNESLLNTDSFCPHRPGCHEFLHKVFLQAGVTYVIDMKSSQFDTYLFLENLNGNVLAQNDDGGDGTNSRIVYTPGISSEYNVVATSFAKGATGSYTITVVGNGQPGGAVINPPVIPQPQGKTFNESLLNTDSFCPNRPGCHEFLHKVYLQAGVTYVIDMKSAQFDTYLMLENLSGQVLAQNDDGGGGTNARIVFTPTVSGEYNIVATSFAQGATGSYTVTVNP